MNAFRPIALILCLALPWLPGASVRAAQVQAKSEVSQSKTAKPAVKTPAKTASKPASKPKPKPKSKPVSKAASKPLPNPKLDLSLPTEMVKNLKPDVGNASSTRKPLLPSMFPEKPASDDSPFQLNGRLISNEMQLQLRNDSRRDVEGAAIDFEFRN